MLARFAPAVLLALALLSACKKANRSAPSGDDLEQQAQAGDVMSKVVLTTADGKEVSVTVEVVSGEDELRQGLMHRRSLGSNAGMLFLMGETRVHTFWMRNTLIPLDMIFITGELTVAGVAADAVPHSEELRSVDTPSLYVLEVNAGWSKQQGVGAGTKVRFENVRELR